MLRMLLAISVSAVCAMAAQVVEGRVISSATGVGIAGAMVRLRAGEAHYSTRSDAQGNFRLDGVEDGAYDAVCTAVGFNAFPGPGAGAPHVQVSTGGQPVHLEIKMDPVSRISGRVLDAAGKPVPGADVWLLRGSHGCDWPNCSPLVQSSKTNEKGEYHVVAPNSPGTWQVSATAPAKWSVPDTADGRRLAWVHTFFPGVTDPQAAEDIAVRPGLDRWDVDIKLKLSPAYTVRGQVLDAGGNPAAKATVALGSFFGPVLTRETREDRTFEFDGVTENAWRLSAELKTDQARQWGARTVRVHEQDVEEVELRMAAPFTIKGKVVLDVPEGMPAQAPPAADITLSPTAALASDSPREKFLIGGAWDGSGDFTIRGLYPGSYMISVLSEPTPGSYLDSIRIGGRDAIAPDVAILSGAEPLIVTYKWGGGTVRGAVEGCGDGHVVLIPREAALRRPGFLVPAPCGPEGRFEFHAVRPGEYYGLAAKSDQVSRVQSIMADDTVLAAASKFTVRANQSVTVELRLIRP
jgi:hypothetical protein